MSVSDRMNVLDGRKALVTGANSGIGAAIAKRFAAAGAAVAVNYVEDQEAAERVLEEIRRAGGEAVGIRADVTREDEVRAMFDSMQESYGSVDILVNNAAVRRSGLVHELSLEDWNDVLAVNLTGQFICAREAIKAFMGRRADKPSARSAGNIICISSVHDRVPWAGQGSYAASKGGAMLLMMTLAQELARHKIRVNSIAPGAIRTPSNRGAFETPAKEAGLLESIPYGRLGDVDDVANAAVWLASDASDFVTGATLYVDGGMSLCPGFREGD